MSESKAFQLIESASVERMKRFCDRFSVIRERCESPIEELLLAALYTSSKDYITFRMEFLDARRGIRERPYHNMTAVVYQQVNIDNYRVDILIQDGTLPDSLCGVSYIVVECDGHNFHERTKEQARHDRKRDRFFQSKGYRVLRFTGSEIWSDPYACADEIIDHLALMRAH